MIEVKRQEDSEATRKKHNVTDAKEMLSGRAECQHTKEDDVDAFVHLSLRKHRAEYN